MLASPFAFYRGAAIIMAADLAASEHTGITVQLCGDAHVSNFGLFGSPERSLVFDINDFDETIRGPFEWDVKRMATSLILGGQEAGVKRGYCRDAALVFLADQPLHQKTAEEKSLSKHAKPEPRIKDLIAKFIEPAYRVRWCGVNGAGYQHPNQNEDACRGYEF